MTKQAPVTQLSNIVRKARKSKGLTLEKLAERSGVSKSMLSQIERGTVSPTFTVLWNLTQSLGIELASLDQSGQSDKVIEHLQAYSTPTKTSADGKCVLRMLTPGRTVLPIEWYQLSMQPGGKLASAPHAPGTYEHLTCTAGELMVSSADVEAMAKEGDTVRYHADVEHSISNHGDCVALAILVVALPAQYASQTL